MKRDNKNRNFGGESPKLIILKARMAKYRNFTLEARWESTSVNLEEGC